MKLCACKGRDGDASGPHTVAWVGDHNVGMRHSYTIPRKEAVDLLL